MQIIGLILVIVGVSLVLLSRDWRASTGALAIHYIGIVILLVQNITMEIAIVELALGAVSTTLVWLANAGKREPTIKSAEEPLSASFQALTLVLCMIAAISLASTYRVAVSPEYSSLNVAFFWLATVGLLALGITRKTLSIGGGLLFLLEAVQIAYLTRSAEVQSGAIFGLVAIQLILVFIVTRVASQEIEARSEDSDKGRVDGQRQNGGLSATEILVALSSLTLLAVVLLAWDAFLSALVLTGIGLLTALLIGEGRKGLANDNTQAATHGAAAMKAAALATFAGICLQVAVVLAGEFQIIRDPLLGRIIVGLAAMGLMASFGAFPFHWWLLELPRRTKPLTAVVVIGCVNFGGLALVVQMLGSYPWLLSDSRSQMALMELGILGYALAALISVSRRDFVHLVLYAAAGNAGVLLASIGTNAYQGLVGGAILALNQSVALLLLLLCARWAGRRGEYGKDLGVEGLSAATRESPFLAVGIALGSLTLVGVPPFAGFLGRWLVFVEVSRQSTQLAVVVVGASLVSLFSFVPVFQSLLGGIGAGGTAKRETAALRVVLLSLALVPLAAGLYPVPILEAVGEMLGRLLIE